MMLPKVIPRMFILLALAGVICPRPLAADEFTLKDGRKIKGTIVGYEGDMFRLQTDYGFILVRKDKVVSIQVEPGQKLEESKNSPSSKPAVSNSPPPKGEQPAAPAKPAPAPVSRPLNQPVPAHLQEHVDGNDYINDTLRFTMFKPPDWKLVEDLHKEKVSAVMAMSSPDDLTLLFVDRQVWSGIPVLGDDRVEANLRQSYQNYKKISESTIQVDGLPAIRRTFTGDIDGAEWHGVSVHFALGNTVFGVIGLTSAETYKFQEAIFNKIVKSFRFLAPSASQENNHSAGTAVVASGQPKT
jgi:hypothetical protein